MGLVPDLLQQAQAGISPGESQRLGLFWQVEHLLSLRQRHQWGLLDSQFGERFEGGIELPTPTVDENQIWHGTQLIEASSIPPLYRLPHRLIVIGFVETPNVERSVLGLAHPSTLPNHQ